MSLMRSADGEIALWPSNCGQSNLAPRWKEDLRTLHHNLGLNVSSLLVRVRNNNMETGNAVGQSEKQSDDQKTKANSEIITQTDFHPAQREPSSPASLVF